MSFDWETATHSILQWTDIEAECEAAGIRFAGPLKASGWRPCFSIDRDEANPSAAVCVKSGNGHLGMYKDSGGGGVELSLFDLLAKQRPQFGGDWRAARSYLAGKSNTPIPRDGSNGHTKPSPSPASQSQTASDPITEICLDKGMPVESFKKFGAVLLSDGKTVAVPMFGPDVRDLAESGVQKVKACSVFKMWPGQKGLNAKGLEAGVFLPGEVPKTGEDWHVAESCKDPAALLEICGGKVLGMHTSSLSPKFAPLLRGCNVYLHAHLDANKAGEVGREKTAAALKGIAASIHFIDYPPALREAGGSDARDLLHKLPNGRDLLIEAIKNAKPWNGEATTEATKATEFTFISSADFAAAQYDQRYLVHKILVAKQPTVIGGKSKAMKTSLAVELALSLGNGTPFLGEFKSHKCNVGVCSGESGEFTIQETALRICSARGVTLAESGVHWCFEVPQLGRPSDILGLRNAIEQNKFDVLLLDPAYLMLLSGDTKGLQASNVFDMGPLLLQLTEIGKATGATVVLIHHCRKNSEEKFAVPELEDLSMAGFGEWARQWLLLGRREPYAQGSGLHRLWLNVGGSAGHSGCWAVDINEGQLAEDFSGRKWDVEIREAADERRSRRDEASRRKLDAKNEQIEKHKSQVLEALKNFPDGETSRALGIFCGLNPKNFGEAVESLVKQKLVVTCHVTKGGQRHGGYKLSPEYHRD